MTKPDFNLMSRTELKAYVLSHRDDLDAIEALFSRRSPTARVVKFPFPNTEMEWQQQQERFQALIESEKKTDTEG